MLAKASQGGRPLNTVTTRRLILAPADYTENALVQVYNVGAPIPLPAEPYTGVFLIDTLAMLLSQELSGGAVATATIEVGFASDPNFFAAASDVFTGSQVAIDNCLDNGVLAAGAGAVGQVMVVANAAPGLQITATLRTTVANVNALTQGDLFLVVGMKEVTASD